MTIETDINAALDSVVSNRVYPNKLPQSPTYPAITYFRVTGRRMWSLSGSANLQNPRFQVDVWAQSYSDARTTADSVITAMAGSSNFKVGGASDQDMYEPDTQLHRVSIDFSVWA